MRRRELLIILILAVLFTYLYIWWEVGNSQWMLPVGFRTYPGLLYPFSFFKWWFPVEIFIKIFVVLAGSWWVLKFVFKKVKKGTRKSRRI